MSRRRVLDPFERWGPVAFMIGGVGFLANTVIGLPDVAGLVQSPQRIVFGPLLFGLWFVFVGQIGLYSFVREGSPRLSLGGVGTAGIGLIIWTVALLAAIAVDLTSGRTFASPGRWAPPLLAGGFVLALLSFLVYGIASTRSKRPSRTLGLLLLIPVVAFLGLAVLLISKIVTGDVIAVLQLVLGGVIGLVLIVVSYRLQASRNGSTSTEPQVDGHMVARNNIVWEKLENWSAVLFLLAAIFLLVTATNRGIAYLVEGYSYGPTESWLGLTVLLGRLAALIGVVGLSVGLLNKRPRLGKVSRAVAVLAVVFTIVLLVLAALGIAGSPTDIIAVFGLGTFLSSFVAYALFGGAILRTNAYSRQIGGLLLAAAAALLVVFFGQLMISVQVIGTIVEASLFVIYLAIGYLLRTESPAATPQTSADSAI